jgi:beta-glucosidase-like glycosyl hydrolase
VGLSALFQAVLALVASGTPQQSDTPALTPREKAALVVVSGLPAPKGVSGVIVQSWSSDLARPSRAFVVADQEGLGASTFSVLPPTRPASSYRTRAQATHAGLATGKALAKEGVDVDLAPVLDLDGGPLGSRHFAAPAYALGFARGLAAGGTAACVKHFPGLGSAQISTDESPNVHARLLPAELAAFRAAVADGVSCVMVGHAYYEDLAGRARASFNSNAYALLRREGFHGVAMTDSISVFGSRWAVPAARRAILAGADLVLLTNGPDAARVVSALIPLARGGHLDEAVAHVLAFRRELGLRELP